MDVRRRLLALLVDGEEGHPDAYTMEDVVAAATNEAQSVSGVAFSSSGVEVDTRRWHGESTMGDLYDILCLAAGSSPGRAVEEVDTGGGISTARAMHSGYGKNFSSILTSGDDTGSEDGGNPLNPSSP